ncbi:hypothetical protein [Actinomyces sp. 432]|uniref:hypothetical protein n=1 Tax=Actinomyces sp. 432 TaxID=2057798 RepID=UPI001F29E6FC|nr:hypothetical protein [Actinomyces sp. 432]
MKQTKTLPPEPRTAGAPRSSGAVDGLDDQAALPLGQVLRQVYAFFYNKTVGLVLILLAGLLGLLGAIFPQMPDSARGMPRPPSSGWSRCGRCSAAGPAFCARWARSTCSPRCPSWW